MVWRVCIASSIILGACGGDQTLPPDAAPVGEVRLEVAGETVRAVLPLPGGGALLFREPTGGGLVEHDVRRTLTWIAASGATIAERTAGANELFLDATTHPSGETTLLVAEGNGCALRRFAPDGTPLGQTPLAEPDLASDPTETPWDPVIPWNVGGCQPVEIRETARVAADGEAVYTVNRGGSSGTVLFRHTFGGGSFTRAMRRPVAPRHPAPLPIGIQASHRVLRSTHWSYVPRVVVDDAGRARVLLVLGSGLQREIWNAFAGAPVADDALAVLLTVSRDGAVEAVREVPRALLRPTSVTDIEGLRWARGGVVLVGRNAPAPLPEDGLGWDGFLVHLVDGEAAPRLARLLDLDGAAVISDAAPLAGGGWLLAGRESYWQNPRGASISEPSSAALVSVDGAGNPVQKLWVPQGARHNGALSIAPAGGAFLVGGLENGPGSHSADGDPAQLAADGWVVRVAAD